MIAAFIILIINAHGQRAAFSLTLENDIFTGTDQYFTNGLHLELQLEKINRPLVKFIVPVFPGFKTQFYGVGITQNIYTPANQISLEFLQHDLPYSGLLFLSLYRVSVNTKNTLRLTTEFNGGVMGPHSYSREVQAGFHRWINNEVPRGWENQLPSELILNYRFELTKSVLETHHVAVLPNANLNVGTILNEVSSGVMIKLGILNPSMQDFLHHEKKLIGHIFMGAEYTYVASNQLLGNVSITHNVYSYQYGAEVSSRSFKISYAVHASTKQREDINAQQYGSITMTFRII